MITFNALPNPFNVVAQALDISRDQLSIESGMYQIHGWDSFGHLDIIMALEKAYGISITNDEMMVLTTMKAIVEFTERPRRVEPSEG